VNEGALIKRMRYVPDRAACEATLAAVLDYVSIAEPSDEFREVGRGFARLVSSYDIVIPEAKRFDPNQPRDRLGRWSRIGGLLRVADRTTDRFPGSRAEIGDTVEGRDFAGNPVRGQIIGEGLIGNVRTFEVEQDDGKVTWIGSGGVNTVERGPVEFEQPDQGQHDLTASGVSYGMLDPELWEKDGGSEENRSLVAAMLVEQLQPRTITRPRQGGNTAASRLTVPKNYPRNVKEGVKIASDAIDATHSFPAPVPDTTVPVKRVRAKSGVGGGTHMGGAHFELGENDTYGTDRIELNEESEPKQMAFTLVHEFGHYLDMQVLGQGDRMESMAAGYAVAALHTGQRYEMSKEEWDKVQDVNPAVANVMEQILTSRRVMSLFDAADTGVYTHVTYDPGTGDTKVGGLTVLTDADVGTAAYQLQPEEAFARAYTQWVMLRSGSPVLEEAFRDRNKWDFVFPDGWEADDFVPIAAAFDQLAVLEKWTEPDVYQTSESES